MPKGEPTRVVRLPVWLLDHLEESVAEGDTLPALITRRLAPRAAPTAPQSEGALRCACSMPTFSKVVSNLCTTCKRMR